MPIPNLPVPLYPDVPDVPGVPPLLRNPNAIPTAAVELMTGDAVGALDQLLGFGPQWGIFDQTGGAVIVGDSVVGFDLSKESRVSDYPVEQGAFASYNKVQTPFGVRLRFTKGGSDAELGAFLASVDAAYKSLYLFTVLTPDSSYPSVNITHYDYSRTSRNGVTLLTVDVWLEEIRVTVQAQFSQASDPQKPVQDPAQPSGADPVSGGEVQPQQVTGTQASSLPAGPAGAPSPGPTNGSGTGSPGSETVYPLFDSNGDYRGTTPFTPDVWHGLTDPANRPADLRDPGYEDYSKWSVGAPRRGTPSL